MKNIGIKVFSDTLFLEEFNKINSFIDHNEIFIEFAFYKNKTDNMISLTNSSFENLLSKNIIYHLNYSLFDYFKYIKNKNSILFLYQEVQQAIEINASKIVFHLEFGDSLPAFNNFTKDRIKDIFVEIFYKLYQKISEAKNIIFSIENTFSDTQWYIYIIEKLKNEGFNVGFTLDIGHAKVWSNTSLFDWIVILKNFKSNDIPLHFHIHKNRGLFDEHLPITSIINCEEDFFSKDLIYDIKFLINEFSEDSFIFESTTQDSIEDFLFFKNNLKK